MKATDKICKAVLNSLKSEPRNWQLENHWLRNKNGIELFVGDGFLFLKMIRVNYTFIRFTFSLFWKIKIWKEARKIIKNSHTEEIKEKEKTILDLFN
ncbi:hypothetical protein SAMN05660772_02842 [Pasteurella testudinis DSM 23072]|uniref:Uncharacterized protein n=1 Tax=Pasteurella testudinis DSM 23072 TaxID=1122938 RepID=A0A1W1V5I1_9PAST|nr:hypothetical protein [Pasteurella testudinis]SMB88622.1 hypothetical protein SAMN05660772_02842 [Pasteurella testudinis DSM 23072]SUB51583.1 Uncharacterised protein [Pasteurella testudinis]